jgi:glycosyltransferase involved in cell wall biosynthesis
MYGSRNQRAKVFEPTLREIESISDLFDSIKWYGYNAGSNPGNAREAFFMHMETEFLPSVQGGKAWFAKFKIIPRIPNLAFTIYRSMRDCDVIHSRGPSVPALICILLSLVYKRKIYWHKYAGNWVEADPPLMYGFQRWLLKRAKYTHVAINGSWPAQQSHIVSLVNPCFSRKEWEDAARLALNKTYNKPLILCFSGLVAESKGVLKFLQALFLMEDLPSQISKVIIAGNGPAFETAQQLASRLVIPVEFTGYLTRHELNEVYLKSHALVLPSRSEGFPKVVAEAASFGCIPLVTDVSSISQYILDGKNGFLLPNMSSQAIAVTLHRLFSSPDLHEISQHAVTFSKIFTYERFHESIARILDVRISLIRNG